jgi:preprotein translocase subunit SecG
MVNLVATIHIVVALLLVGLVLLQDSKDGAMGGMMGGGSSNSLLGATGATTLFEKLTRYVAIVFAVTCILLTVMTARDGKSLLDSYIPAAPATAPGTAEANGAAATPSDAAAAPTADKAAPAAPTTATAPADAAAPAAADKK